MGRTYQSENIKDKTIPYKFIGCGAHKFYHDVDEWGVDQVAGYPYTLCYTYGGKAGCSGVPTTQQFSLNDQISYRKNCGGDYDCNAVANSVVTSGEEIGMKVLDEFDGNGILQDWTNCCRECRFKDGCVNWGFDISNMNCHFYSGNGFISALIIADPPVSFTGKVGYDDHPVDCHTYRNEYDTCEMKPLEGLFGVGILFLVLGLIISILNLVLFDAWFATIIYPCYAVLCKTNDFRRLPTTVERKSSRDKHGNVHYYNEITYGAEVIYKCRGIMKSKKFFSTNECCLPGSHTFFYLIVNPNSEYIFYNSGTGSCMRSWKFLVSCAGFGLSLAGVIFLCFFSSFVVHYDGVKFISNYYLPIVQNPYSTEAWITAMAGFIIIVFLLFFYWIWENFLLRPYLKSKIDPENIHDLEATTFQLTSQE